LHFAIYNLHFALVAVKGRAIAEARMKQLVLLCIKAPVKGQVKSRLAAFAGEDFALELYKNFILDIVDTVEKSGHPFRICVYPPSAEKTVSDWLRSAYHTMPQIGDDLGAKMENAFKRVFAEGFTSAVLIGSDIPDLLPAVLNEAFESLKNNDVVVGPAVDGGYYLIGFNKGSFCPRAFQGIAWSTSAVFRETMDIINTSSLRVHLAPEWRDVDTMDDLQSLFERNRNTMFAESRTMTYLQKSKLLKIASGGGSVNSSMKT
jgi:rSAM/selenodomain-associated transferase 1